MHPLWPSFADLQGSSWAIPKVLSAVLVNGSRYYQSHDALTKMVLQLTAQFQDASDNCMQQGDSNNVCQIIS